MLICASEIKFNFMAPRPNHMRLKSNQKAIHGERPALGPPDAPPIHELRIHRQGWHVALAVQTRLLCIE